MEFLASIKIIMSEKIVSMLFNHFSELHENKGITYEDAKIVITKNTIDNLK